MSGTVEGGRKAYLTNITKHGKDFYREIGSSRTGGFASMVVSKDGLTGLQRAKIAGKKGGAISRRGSVKTKRTNANGLITEEAIRNSSRFNSQSTEAEVEARIAWARETGESIY